MISGVGLGFRRDIAEKLLKLDGDDKPRFIEFAPENWMGLGGHWGRMVRRATEKYPVLSHGLSLSIGSPDELDFDFIKELRKFLDEFNIEIYSEHLSYSKSKNAHLYDLLPIPFREDAVRHIVERIKTVQEILERPLALENVSYYTPVAAEMTEPEFINAIIRESGCNMLLDVNNVYVNAFNHNYEAKKFIDQMPLDKVVYIHMAGHEKVQPDLIIDTHGKPIIAPVYELFEWTINKMKPVPVLLERDYNFPQMDELLAEVKKLQAIADIAWENKYVVK